MELVGVCFKYNSRILLQIVLDVLIFTTEHNKNK